MDGPGRPRALGYSDEFGPEIDRGYLHHTGLYGLVGGYALNIGHGDIKTAMGYTHPDDSLKDALESRGNFGHNATLSLPLI